MTYVLALIAIGVSLLEAVSYPGFILKNLHVSPYVIYALFIFILPAAQLKNVHLRRLTILGAVFATVSMTILESLENYFYPNFVFTYTHVNLTALEVFVFVTSFFAVSAALVKGTYSKKLLASLLVAILVAVSSRSAGGAAGFAAAKLKGVIVAPTASYADKMSAVYPGFYTAMQLTRELTPATATVIIPPQRNPWEVEGNAAMVRYFLYPRLIVPTSIDKPFPSITGANVYALIAKGSWEKRGDVNYGWPKVALPASTMWKYENNSTSYEKFERSYDPVSDAWDWGLIKLSYE
jgi:hypothetical protein